MSKTNFTKVEEALAEGLLKISVEQFLNLADAASKNTTADPSQGTPAELQRKLIACLKIEISYLYKNDRALFEKLPFKPSDYKKFIANPTKLTQEDWESVKELKRLVDIYKKNEAAKAPPVTNEELVERERAKSVNKRFNVSDKWLPLQ